MKTLNLVASLVGIIGVGCGWLGGIYVERRDNATAILREADDARRGKDPYKALHDAWVKVQQGEHP